MTSEQFNECRDDNGVINLLSAFYLAFEIIPFGPQKDYLETISKIRPIHSRQCAAIALATASTLSPN